jgi:hypothetical protein
VVSQKSKDKTSSGHGDEIDALFQLPLTEFTAARNALAAKLKKAGDAEQAEEVRALPKPPISAWTVNQLFWRQRAAYDKLIEAGQRFRTAQAAQLAGRSTDLRGPLEARREALADLSKLAADLLREAGHAPTPDVMRRITTTLEALSTYGGIPETPQGGRLWQDVDPPGFETLAALVPRIGKTGAASGPSKVLSFHPPKKKAAAAKKLAPEEAERLREQERKDALVAARAALQASERALRDARKQAEHAEAQLKKVAARAKETEKEYREIEKEKAAIDKRFEKASTEAEAARQEARRIAEEAEAAAQAVEDAERDLETAKRQVEQISD